jgi:hypothetical protein
VLPVIGVPSASATPHRGRPAAHYHVYRLSGRPDAWRLDIEVREGVPGTMEFRTQRKFGLDLRQGGLPSGGLKEAMGLPSAHAASKNDGLLQAGKVALSEASSCNSR